MSFIKCTAGDYYNSLLGLKGNKEYQKNERNNFHLDRKHSVVRITCVYYGSLSKIKRYGPFL